MKQRLTIFLSGKWAAWIVAGMLLALFLLSLADVASPALAIPPEWRLLIVSAQRVLFIGAVSLTAWSLGLKAAIAVFSLGWLLSARYVLAGAAASGVALDALEFVIASGIAVGVIWVVSFARDGSLRLARSEQNFRNSIDNSSVGISIVNRDGRLVYVNKSLLDFYGYASMADLRAVPLRDRFTPRSYAEHQERRRRMDKENICSHSIELEIVRKDGVIRHLAASCNKVIWDGRQHALVTYQDITERKEAEENRRAVEQKAQVASRLAAIGEMAAGMAHEINNPLTAIIGYADLVLEHEGVPEDVKEDIRLIADSGHRVADIVSRLLAFARQSKTVRICSDLNELIEGTLKMRQYALKTGGIEVERNFDPELPPTTVDPLQLQQVFLNLIVNAEQAMKSARGRGVLRIATSLLPGDIIRLSFTDDGPGINPENIDKLFHPFFTTKPVGEGTGLGLSLSHGIVSQHDGALYCRSELGQGASFIIELPVSSESDEAAPAPQPPAAACDVHARVLVIDDEDAIRAFISRSLAQLGHQVESTASAVEALAWLFERDYDAVILDIRMPGLSGIDIYHRLKERRPDLARRLIFITGDVMGGDVRRFFEDNQLHYLMKPFSKAEIASALCDLLPNLAPV